MKETYKDIHGWCDREIITLYDRAIAEAKDGSVFVEIGCYLGKSTCYMIDEIKKSGKNITFHVIDNFSTLGDVEQQFKENLGQERLDNINLIREDSSLAAKYFDSESVDFLFIDTDHFSWQLVRELTEWLPKVKKGALLGGHDFHMHDTKNTFSILKIPFYNVIYAYVENPGSQSGWEQTSWWFIKE
jgi:hypothetical protein